MKLIIPGKYHEFQKGSEAFCHTVFFVISPRLMLELLRWHMHQTGGGEWGEGSVCVRGEKDLGKKFDIVF